MVKLRTSIRQRFAACSFRRQLTVLSSLGLLGLALAIALASGGFLAWRLESLALALLGEVTGQLANESRLVFLESPASARERVARIAAFPGVRQAALLKPDAEPWVASPDAGRWPPVPRSREGPTPAAPIHEDRDCWYFVAPVRVGADETSPVLARTQPQLLGYVAVAWRKAPLAQLRTGLFVLNGGIALVLAVGIFAALEVFLRRLTVPLDQLAGVMRRIQAGETGPRAAVAGPAETREIGRVFNALLERLEQHRAALEQHRAALESEVWLRTQELRAARDLALTADRYKSAFLAAMSHEMRTPLQNIIGYTQESEKKLKFLEGDADPAILGMLSEYFGIVLQAADELLLRINQVLELAALEAGRREVVREKVELPRLVDEVVAALKLLAARNRNRVDVVCEGLERVELDGDKLRQIVRNLLDNACKFTHDGAVRLWVRAGNGVLSIEVTDSGIGIPQDQFPLIFEPFRQVDMSDTRRYGGTGLGLAITKNVCQLLGGAIAVDSTPGVGSRFRVVIPLPDASRLNEGSSAPEPPDAAAR
jgi:signal transduction histidine kinase